MGFGRINAIDLQSSTYTGVFNAPIDNVQLPKIYSYFEYPSTAKSKSLLTAANHQSILSQWQVNTGRVYLFSIPLSPIFSNFTDHSLFLPTFFQIAFHSIRTPPPYYRIGEDVHLPVPQYKETNELIYHLTHTDLAVDLIPETHITHTDISLDLHSGISKSGTYNLTNGDSVIAFVTFNYPRMESNLTHYTALELSQIIDRLGLNHFSVFDTEIDTFTSDFHQRQKGIAYGHGVFFWFSYFCLPRSY